MHKGKIAAGTALAVLLFLACGDPPGGSTTPPDPPAHTQPWTPAPAPNIPIGKVGEACPKQNAQGQTSDQRPLRCRDGKWRLS